ncbi:hypothetical protein INS49_013360 [Diaporthe citri]|uniref:uncharacterized protein n=1 Tax=Diaporthe citri TaxID=83186 RepID=UPI001C7E89F4|nr:uncharacterized protein INS49_013360 [Diaporthe citri]KAG6357483.1 hypothetical protein INS49_013360 [Diaporthe citri]
MVEESDPILQIAIGYNKPAADVLFDALFTATSPSLGKNNFAVAQPLLNLLEDINSLGDVRTFARIVLGVFDAFNLIQVICVGIPLRLYAIEDILAQICCLDPLDVDDFQWKAIIGIMMTVDFGGTWKRRLEQWKKVRWPKFKTQSESLWLCLQHASQLAPAQPHVETVK